MNVNEYFKKYQVKYSKEIRSLSKNMIMVQNNLYQRAAEEILELCNETLVEIFKKQKDNFKDVSKATCMNSILIHYS